MTYSLDGIISNAVVRSGGAGRSGLHMILQIGMYSYFRMFLAPSYADTVTCLYDMAVGPKFIRIGPFVFMLLILYSLALRCASFGRAV